MYHSAQARHQLDMWKRYVGSAEARHRDMYRGAKEQPKATVQLARVVIDQLRPPGLSCRVAV